MADVTLGYYRYMPSAICNEARLRAARCEMNNAVLGYCLTPLLRDAGPSRFIIVG